MVVNQLMYRRMIAAHRAFRIAAQFQLAEAHSQSVVKQQAADQRFAQAQDQLHGFGCLDQSDRARQDAQHAAFGAARNQTRGRRFGIKAPVARPTRVGEDRRLPLETENRAVHVGLFQQHASVVDQITSGEVVGAVDHHVVVFDDVERVFAGDGGVKFIDRHERIDVEHRIRRRIQLLPAHILGSVNHLPLQICEIDHVEIDDADAAHTGSCQVQSQRRA